MISVVRRLRALGGPLPRRLAAVGQIFLEITGHDSGCVSYGMAEPDGSRWFVKAAYGPDVGQLRSAQRFHAAVGHPAIVALAGAVALPDGLALVYPFVEGENLDDPVAPRSGPEPGLDRFVRQSDGEILAVLDDVIEAHRSVAAAGFVAVDFYHGSLLYDFATLRVHLIDLDLYRPGPYLLDTARQFGSRRFMAPEEFHRGATIDERSTVFTLGRTARTLLGPSCASRLGSRLDEVICRALQEDPSDRWPDVATFADAWRRAR